MSARPRPEPAALTRRSFLCGGFLSQLAEAIRPADVTTPAPAPPPPRANEPEPTPPWARAARRAGPPPPPGGPARILNYLCLAHQGTACSACREHCPMPGAITLLGGRPQVVAALCTGCGACVDVCPAPAPAVVRLPLPPRTP